MLLESLVTRRVSEENESNSSLTRRVTKQCQLLLAALGSGTAVAVPMMSISPRPPKRFSWPVGNSKRILLTPVRLAENDALTATACWPMYPEGDCQLHKSNYGV